MKLFTPRKIKIVAITLASFIVLVAVAISMPWCGILKGDIRYLDNLPHSLIFMHLGKPDHVCEAAEVFRKRFVKRGYVPKDLTIANEYEIKFIYWHVSQLPWYEGKFIIGITSIRAPGQNPNYIDFYSIDPGLGIQ